MAMTAEQKAIFRTAFASEKHANLMITIIDGGSASTLTGSTKVCIANAMANQKHADSLIAALTTGSALSTAAIRCFRNIIGNKTIADAIVTQINAIS